MALSTCQGEGQMPDVTETQQRRCYRSLGWSSASHGRGTAVCARTSPLTGVCTYIYVPTVCLSRHRGLFWSGTRSDREITQPSLQQWRMWPSAAAAGVSALTCGLVQQVSTKFGRRGRGRTLKWRLHTLLTSGCFAQLIDHNLWHIETRNRTIFKETNVTVGRMLVQTHISHSHQSWSDLFCTC